VGRSLNEREMVERARRSREALGRAARARGKSPADVRLVYTKQSKEVVEVLDRLGRIGVAK